LISLLELAERAYRGPRMGEKEWDLGLFRKMQRLVEVHKLAYSGPDRYLDVDDDYVDRAFRAAVAFLSEAGVYCISTNRVIHFDEEEVLDAVKSAPHEFVVGEGRDARVVRKRTMEDRRRVNVISGGHCPWPQDVASMAQTAYARVLRGDIIEGFNLAHIDGYEVHGLPLAVYAARREFAIMREAVRKAGRPGMAVTLYPILTKAGPLIAPIDPDTGLRRTDGLLLSVLPDMKVEADYLATAITYEGYGGYKVNGGCFSIIGGFCGGVEGAIIEAIAKGITAWMVYRDVFQYGGTVSGSRSLTARWTPAMEEKYRKAPTLRSPIWSTYVVQRALSRNTNIIRFGGIEGRAGIGGIGSEAELLSMARDVIANTVMGCNLVCTTGSNPTPYHVEFRARVADATVRARIKQDEVRGLMEEIDDLVTERLHGVPLVDYGDRRMLAYKDFESYFAPMREMYDFPGQKPSKVLVANATKAGAILAALGLDLEAAATRL
jgi:methylamine--corrinoid protein Co-methyltransferase